MLSNHTLERILTAALSKGGDFSEVYVEKSQNSGIALINGVVDQVSTGINSGIGIRILEKTKCVYVFSNDLNEEILIQMAKSASASLENVPEGMSVHLNAREEFHSGTFQISPVQADKRRIIEILKNAANAAKTYHESISQTSLSYAAGQKHIWIANSNGLYRTDERISSRLGIDVVASSNNEKQNGFSGPGARKGFEFIENYPVEETAKAAAESAVKMLQAKLCPSGKMPVIIDNGFGGVIFHEACGHALEATSVGVQASVFTDKLGEQIANSLITAYDDGTIPDEWGSLAIDDEGEDTRKNLLIENGILKGYLVDLLGSRRMDMPLTGSSRRQSYQYAPTSRMTNTYIANGKDSPKDIISDTPYGLYAKSMGGGSVDPATGEFNFAVNEAYIIRNGEIAEPVRGATLIGKGSDILMQIDKVGNNLQLAQGMCGSMSGSIPVDVGQPMIRVAEITVGGHTPE